MDYKHTKALCSSPVALPTPLSLSNLQCLDKLPSVLLITRSGWPSWGWMAQEWSWWVFCTSDRTGWTLSGSSTCRPKVYAFVVFTDSSHFMPIEQDAAILPVEAALEVGIGSTFHHDAEDSVIPHLEHSDLAHNDCGWSSEDNSSSSDEEAQASSVLSRPLTNVYSMYSQLQWQT